MSQLKFTLTTIFDEATLTVFKADGTPIALDSSHPMYKDAVAKAMSPEASTSGDKVAIEIEEMLAVSKAVARKFERLSERVTVRDGEVCIDGDPVQSQLTEQILDFLNEGLPFEPLVNFYEKLLTNPLGDVQASLFDWITRQRQDGSKLTITEDGDVIGYKSVTSRTPEWRTDVVESKVFVPSRRSAFSGDQVNGIEVKKGEYIEQVVGDMVEMPRSKVLHDFSQACGDGLHVGTWAYAKGFTGDTVMLVRFSPRDVVSVPSHEGKIRVCRYVVLGTTNEPAKASLIVEDNTKGELVFDDKPTAKTQTMTAATRERSDVAKRADASSERVAAIRGRMSGQATQTPSMGRTHGSGGSRSTARSGAGRSPHQGADGRFVKGRPGSKRGPNGQFVKQS